jgi:hypothetical protein
MKRKAIILGDIDMEDIWGLDDQETKALIGPEASQPHTTHKMVAR